MMSMKIKKIIFKAYNLNSLNLNVLEKYNKL